MSKKQILTVIGILVLLGLVVYFIVRLKSKKNETETVPGKGPDPFPLKYGSESQEVGQLQKYLIREFGAKISPSGAVDNNWGPMTEKAVQDNLHRDNISASFYYKTKMDKY